jgi:uncharacterized metal-binding protein YceD (DUF177 family)
MDFVLSLERIPESGLDLTEAVSFDEVRELLPEQWTGLEAPLDLTLRIEHHGEAISLVGHLRGRLVGLCSRCAADVSHTLDERFAALFTAEDDNDVKLGDGFSGAEVGVHEWYPLRSGAVDLSEPFRDALALGVPDYPRCPEGHCDPAVERFLVQDEDERTKEVDPRLAKLIELRERMKDS